MAEDDESYESFTVNDQDLEFAMNPGRRHFQTRDQATYGMWADKDDSDDEQPSSSNRSRGGGRPKRDSAPVSFVSGGVKIGNHVESANGGSSKMDESQSPFDLRPAPKKKKTEMGAHVMAGMRTSAVKGTVDPAKFGDWAKFGKGSVIMNMMKSMGYKEGQGLGADGQGIIEPVAAKVRLGRAAVGAYGSESVGTGQKFGESAADAQRRMQAEQNQEVKLDDRSNRVPVRGTWKKSGVTKTKYKTIEEVIQEGGSIGYRSATQTGVKVIDMTGPEQRVYSGYDSFSLKTKVDVEEEDRDVFDVPALRQNLNLLLDMTEEGIRRNDSQMKTLKDQTTALEYDLKQIREVLTKEENQEQRLRDVFDIIEKFSHRTGVDAPSINDCQTLFLTLREKYSAEYALFNLESVAIPCVLPQITSYFSKWRPLDPDHLIYGIDLMKEWKDILVADNDALFAANITSFEKLSAYDRLLWEGWLPTLRRAALSWDPRDQMEPMLRIIESWLPVLPAWIKENVLEQVIIPRIAERVSSWDPLTDVVPIHSWLVPWLAILGDRLQPVLTPIRQKLAKALQKWYPTDSSAMAILKPWRGVWAPATMSAFLAQNVVPKLEKCLDKMNLNPKININYEEWHAVVSWLEMINPDTIANVVTKYFFPRWYEVLCGWLDADGVVITEVRMWYSEWELRIPSQIKEFPTIKENLKRAMVAMMHSMQGVRVSNGPPPPPLLAAAPPPPPPPIRNRDPAPSLSHKDVVQMLAEKHGLTYVPQPDRFKDGRPVYWFGAKSIYLDRNIIYVMDTADFVWRAVSTSELLSMACV